MTSSPAWLAARLDGAPARLAGRVTELAGAEPGAGGDLPDRLAGAARTALRRTVAGPGTRDGALDLLAADTLVTLSLLARAETNPAGLAAFANRVRIGPALPSP